MCNCFRVQVLRSSLPGPFVSAGGLDKAFTEAHHEYCCTAHRGRDGGSHLLAQGLLPQHNTTGTTFSDANTLMSPGTHKISPWNITCMWIVWFPFEFYIASVRTSFFLLLLRIHCYHRPLFRYCYFVLVLNIVKERTNGGWICWDFSETHQKTTFTSDPSYTELNTEFNLSRQIYALQKLKWYRL